jgi:rhodanese-related sulfurtransferase
MAHRSIVSLLLASAALGGSLAAADAFPLRASYPQVEPIATEDLAREIGKALVVDVRSRFEYTVMHIDGARHVDLSGADFPGRLLKAADGDKARRIVTYCNGTTCEKSYEAAALALKAGFSAVRVYDAGIVEWSRLARGRTLLFGRPIRPADIIPDSQFKERLLDGASFQMGSAGPDALLVDVRDPQQRAETAAFASGAVQLPVDDFVKVIAGPGFRNRAQGKTLYVFDNVGKQVRWVQYALRANKYERYFFLKDGMAGLTPAR